MIININTRTIIVIIALVAIMAFLFIRNCNDRQPVITENIRSLDSLKAVHKYRDSVNAAEKQLLHDSIVKYRFSLDSARNISVKKDKQLEVSKAEVAVLVTKGYLIHKDSSKLLQNNCDSLRVKALTLSEDVTDYQKTQENLISNNGLLFDMMTKLAKTKDSAYKELKGEFDFLAGKFSKLDYNYQKSSKNASKRFGIGPQTGVTYMGKLTYYIGIGFQWNILKF